LKASLEKNCSKNQIIRHYFFPFRKWQVWKKLLQKPASKQTKQTQHFQYFAGGEIEK